MLATPKIFYSHLADGSIDPVYLWDEESHPQRSSVVIIHDLFEDMSFYHQDIAWWIHRGHAVWCFNIHYYGTQKNARYAGSMDKVCYNILQVLALVRSHCSMHAPIVYTRGIGALAAIRIARKNTKFISSLVGFSPFFALKKPPTGFHEYLIQSLKTTNTDMRIPKFMMPRITEQTFVSTFKKRSPSGSLVHMASDDPEDVGSADSSSELDPSDKFDSFSQFAQAEFQRTFASYPHPRISEGRITAAALLDYLKAAKASSRLCSRLKVPCLFILPAFSHHLDYQVLYKVQKKFGAMISFEIQKQADFDDIIHPSPSEEFEQMGEKYMAPWYERSQSILDTEYSSSAMDMSISYYSDTTLGETGETTHDESESDGSAPHVEDSTVVNYTLGATIESSDDFHELIKKNINESESIKHLN